MSHGKRERFVTMEKTNKQKNKKTKKQKKKKRNQTLKKQEYRIEGFETPKIE